MNIISVDLPWNPDKRGHRAVVVADLAGNIKIITANDDELVKLVGDSAEPDSLVLLDVPVDGCENLGGKHCRAVDRALLRQGISILPTSKAGNRGRALRERIQNSRRGREVVVLEIYPYAVYKFLAYLKDRELLGLLKLDKFDTLLDEGFRAYLPPKYKRERKKEERLRNMEYLYSLLTDAGLNYRIPLRYPEASGNLGQLSDEYDACLGAIVGIYWAANSSYACIAGDSNSGNILLLADRWLAGELGREVRIDNRKKEKIYEIGS